MILPEKHIKNSESLLGIGFLILKFIKKKPLNIDDLWNKVEKNNENSKISFDNFILSIDFLFIINSLTMNSLGELKVETN